MVHRLRAVALTFLAAATFATIAPPAVAGAATPRPAASLNGARSVLVISLPATAWIDLRGAAAAEPHPPAPPQRGRRPRDPHRAEPHPARCRVHGVRRGRSLGRAPGGRGDRTSSATSATRAPTPARSSGPAPASTSDPASVPSAGPSSPSRTTRRPTTPRSARWAPPSIGAGIGRFVIANADETSVTGPVLHREAALTLMDDTGRVPGQVTGPAAPAPTAPFGRGARPRRGRPRVPRRLPDPAAGRAGGGLGPRPRRRLPAASPRRRSAPRCTRPRSHAPTSSSADSSATSTCSATRSWSSRRTTRARPHPHDGRDPRAARRHRAARVGDVTARRLHPDRGPRAHHPRPRSTSSRPR